jgi:hypothetical protein
MTSPDLDRDWAVIRRIILLSHSAVSVFDEAARNYAVRGLLTDCNVIDEVFIASDAGRSSAGL